MINRLWSVIQKEVIQITQDRLLVIFLILAPVLELFLIGNMEGGVGGAGLYGAMIDLDNSAASREVAAAIENTGDIDLSYYPDTLDEAGTLLDRGDVSAIIVIPDDFESNLSSLDTAAIQVIFDGANISAAGDAQAAIIGAISSYGAEALIEMAGPLYTPSGIDMREKVLYNSSMDSYYVSLTSLFALIVFQIVLLSAVMTIVREREVGTLEQVNVTPLRGVEFVAGKAIAPIILSLIDFLFMVLLAVFVFDIPLRGSFGVLFGATLIYMVAEVGFALLFSAASRTQAQAITFAFIWVMVALTMSGFLIPVTGLPGVLRYLSMLLPLQHYITIVKAVMLKGAGFLAIWPNIAALVGIAIAMTAFTLFVLRRIGDG